MAKLRVGVIGAGAWAVTSHLPVLARRDAELELVGVCRRGAAELADVKERFGFTMASEDYRDVLAEGLDVCLVCSPAALHVEHAMAAMTAGAHVMVEKPFTIASEDAWAIARAAKTLDRHVVVAYGWNYLPLVRRMRDLVRVHGVGDIEHLMLHMGSTTRDLLSNRGSYPQARADAVPEPTTWTDASMSGGGYGQAQLTHLLGIALWITGLRGAEVFALMSSPLDAPVELHDAISVRYEGGAIGTISGGSAFSGANGNKNQLELRAIGSSGQLHLDVERERAWLWRPDGTDVTLSVRDGDGDYTCEGPPNTIVDLALGREVENCSPAELGARTVEILEAAYRSAATGQLETVSGGHRP